MIIFCYFFLVTKNVTHDHIIQTSSELNTSNREKVMTQESYSLN